MQKNNKKKIYIVMTKTYTTVAKIIRIFTRNDYSHVSITFDKSCKKMYSFGRKYTRIAFIGTFKEENIHKGVFALNKNTNMAIYELKVTPYQYKIIKQKIKEIEKNNHGFNILGLILAIFRIKLNRNKYYCSEFVNELLSNKKVKIMNRLNEVVRPEEFKDIEGSKLIYEGKIEDYEPSF